MGKIKDTITSIRVGARVKDLGQVDEVIIRYKDKLVSILEDPESGEIKSLGWMDGSSLHTQVPIRDFWEAKPPKDKSQ